jgi:uncharacterized membrane protein
LNAPNFPFPLRENTLDLRYISHSPNLSEVPMPRIPARFAPLLFGLFLSGFMSLLVSGIATVRAIGIGEGFAAAWLTSWTSSWIVAFPVVLVVAPLVRRLVARLCEVPA